jgi:hypothetical protein
MSFSSDLNRFRQTVIERHIKIKRKAAFDLFSAIIMETPVDKGVLRNNWFVEMGAHGSRATTTEKDKTGVGTRVRTSEKLRQTSIEKDIVFTNNLPYAARIEFDGWSGKAPDGMVRVNTMRWPSIVRVVARAVRNGG